MKLKDAMICLNCDEVFHINQAIGIVTCPDCKGIFCHRVSTWIPTDGAVEKIVRRLADALPREMGVRA